MSTTLDDRGIQKLPEALQWAFRTVRAHPHVRDFSVSIDSSDSDTVQALFAVRTELPGRWKSESPTGVRRLEYVLFNFGLDYPRRAPKAYLRGDFNRSHPHLQPGLPDSLPQPCLVDGSPRELLQARGGINALLDQLVLWLERASEVNLIDPEHGWEPTRRDSIQSVLIADSSELRGGITDRGGCTCFQSDLHWDSSREYPAYWSYIRCSSQQKITRSCISSLKRSVDSEAYVHSKSLTFFAWPGKNIDGTPKIDSAYTPETVSTVHAMFNRAHVFGCQIDLKIQIQKLRSLLDRCNIAHPIPIIFILTARRPCHLIGTSTPYELCPYLVFVQNGSDLLPNSSTMVMPMGHRDTVSLEVLRRTSGSSHHLTQRTWSSVGCGSVGSKLAMHLAREGGGPNVVLDRGFLEPHNYARHSALPLNPNLDQMVFRRKSTQLALDLRKLGQHVEDYHKDVVDLLGTVEKDDIIGSQIGELLVNSTGSLVVREVLANATWAEQCCRPRVVECCLMGAGAVGYISVEGVNGNPNSSDMITEFYHILQSQPDVACRVFGADTDLISVGQGCGSQSFIMSDAEISQHVAPFGRIVSSMLSNSENTFGAFIQYQILGEDGIEIRSFKICVDPFIIVPGDIRGGPATHLSVHVANSIEAQIRSAQGTETGGVLIGRYSSIGHTFHVVDMIPAPIDSVFSPELFVLGTSGLNENIQLITINSGGALYALGTWHNHLTASEPSSIDHASAHMMAKSQQFPLLMLIHTPTGYKSISPPPNEI